MIAFVKSTTLVGVDAALVEVECEVTRGLPGYHVVGMPAPSVKEGAVRIRSALNAAGLDLPLKKVTVNLAPADLRKPGCALDLPIALAVLLADASHARAADRAAEREGDKKHHVCLANTGALDGLIVMGELGLDGTLRAVKGVLAAALLARRLGLRGVLVPDACAAEAEVVDDVEVFGAQHLREVLAALRAESALPLPRHRPAARRRPVVADMAEVRGQAFARAAIEVAVAGGHNLLLAGPPGTGKTMLARRIPTVLPVMTRDEALETTKVYSSLGLADGLIEERPFRAPHHTISTAALLGGGSVPRAGEISLAHNGVLFLDELPEFTRGAVESLRQPLEERAVTIGRIHGSIRLPSSFLLVAAANPCPCGWLGSNARECTCGPGAIERYRARMSGPLLDRIDLHVRVEPVSLADLRRAAAGESSAVVRERVAEARARQVARLAPWHLGSNAEMPPAVVRATCRLDDDGEQLLGQIVAGDPRFTARSIDRLIRVARTVADLLGQDAIDRGALLEAAAFRTDLTAAAA